MAVETPDVINALATIGLVGGDLTLIKSAGILAFESPATGIAVLKLQDPIDPASACISVTGRRGYAPTATVAFNPLDPSELGIFILGADNAPWNAPIDVIVTKTPVSENTPIMEDPPLVPRSNWNGTGNPGGGGGGPPTGSAGGDLGGMYPNPAVLAVEFDGPDRYTFGGISDGQVPVAESGVLIGENYYPLIGNGRVVGGALSPGSGGSVITNPVPGRYTITFPNIADYLKCAVSCCSLFAIGGEGYNVQYDFNTSVGQDISFAVTNELGVLVNGDFQFVIWQGV